uniref:protein-serine/threonine phosphatase n=1 Tax=Ascaris lumbricoides TaxID=6252 RepID=A0A9J2PB69_ASCLU
MCCCNDLFMDRATERRRSEYLALFGIRPQLLSFWTSAPCQLPVGMGQTLSEPVTTKETASCANSFYKIGSSCMQGWRINMEDAHTHLLAVPDDNKAAFFAVYDGHGGSKVSQYAGTHLHKTIATNSLYSEGKIEEAIKEGFLSLDEKMKHDEEMREDMSGTTAVVVIIKNKKIYCGNVGDSRAVACVSGVADPLSFDHKPANESEARRIVAAGGWVEFNRVNGNLALSRALGDFAFKKNEHKSPEEQIVTACPDVTVCDLTYDHEFIVLACDGIWDVMSNQEVVDFCRDRLAVGREPETICEELLSRCLAPDCQMGGLGCDNMTVVLVCLLQDDSPEAYQARCSRKPAENTAAGDVQNADSETYVTPEASPVRIEAATMDFLKSAGEGNVTKVTVVSAAKSAYVENDDEEPPREFTVNAEVEGTNDEQSPRLSFVVL